MKIEQSLNITIQHPIDRALKYYSILSLLHNLNLTQKELELLAFTAIRGTITPPSAKQDFVKRFKCNEDYVNNLKSHLTRKGYLIKDNGQHRVNPRMLTDFTKDFTLKINLNGREASIDK